MNVTSYPNWTKLNIYQIRSEIKIRLSALQTRRAFFHRKSRLFAISLCEGKTPWRTRRINAARVTNNQFQLRSLLFLSCIIIIRARHHFLSESILWVWYKNGFYGSAALNLVLSGWFPRDFAPQQHKYFVTRKRLNNAWCSYQFHGLGPYLDYSTVALLRLIVNPLQLVRM